MRQLALAELQSWEKRAPEEANLLNPAFVAVVIYALARGHEKESKTPLPYILTFVALPLLLTPFLRDLVPSTVKTNLPGWLQDNEGALLDFPERSQALVPWVQQGMLFAFRANNLTLESEALRAGTLGRRPRNFTTSEEVELIRQRAYFVGRWFAGSGNPTTLMGLFGLQP